MQDKSGEVTSEGTIVLCLLGIGMWELWKHRNDIVFNGAAPSLARLTRRIDSEGRAWRQAGLLKGDLDGFFTGLATWVVHE